MNASGQAHLPPVIPAGDFYVTGGTLRPDAPSYIERQADKDLCAGLLRGEFCYVLTSRQMGKSSLMVRTVQRLRQDGAAVAVLDLTAIGQNLTIEQWYDGLMSRLGQQLGLEDELLAHWEGHPEFGPLQRWLTAIEDVVLRFRTGQVVIFVDEIDIVRSLPFSTDEFFAAIREAHNRRSRDPAFQRLAFGLLGVAAPTDLIRDTRMTPFNIGRRIELHDFTAREAAPLAQGLSRDAGAAALLLERVLYWTGGHPYLTQRLCRALAETLHPAPVLEPPGQPAVPPVLATVETVDRLAATLFLSRQARDRDDNLIFVRERLLRSEVDVAGLLYLYRKVCLGQAVPDDETNPLCSVLRLSGIARGVDGYLEVRNRIYAYVFDLRWIQSNMPEPEVRRQRSAGRRGILVGLGIAVALLLAYLLFGPVVRRYRQERLARHTIESLQATYRSLKSYQDTFETTVEIGLGGNTVPITGSGSLIFERPNKVNLVLKSRLNSPPLEVRLLSDGRSSWTYLPALNEYQVTKTTMAASAFEFPRTLAAQVGPLRVLPLYRLFLPEPMVARFAGDVQNIHFGGYAEIDGQAVRLIEWEQPADLLLSDLGLTKGEGSQLRIPVSAWIGGSNGVVIQFRVDLSRFAVQLLGSSSDLPITSLNLTETHRLIESSPTAFPAARFTFEPNTEARPVKQFDLPAPNFWSLATPQRLFSRLIPPRLSFTPANLIDLSDYYNAALAQAWHPGYGNNNLEVLPCGLLQLAETTFDVRGIVQLSGRELYAAGGRYPQKIAGIRVGQICRQLQFLHATGWRAPDGAKIGAYLIHYKDGQERTYPIVYGEDVRDWNARADPGSRLRRARVAWTGVNRVPLHVRLFKSTWINPLPEIEIESIDYVSTMSDSAPFLVALTAEP